MFAGTLQRLGKSGNLSAIEVAVSRITQEALTNVVLHAQAKTCVARLAVNEDVTLDISGDGVCIPGERTAGVGLSSMHEHVTELGERCVIRSVPEGAVLECWCVFLYRRSEKLETFRILVA